SRRRMQGLRRDALGTSLRTPPSRNSGRRAGSPRWGTVAPWSARSTGIDPDARFMPVRDGDARLTIMLCPGSASPQIAHHHHEWIANDLRAGIGRSRLEFNDQRFWHRAFTSGSLSARSLVVA